MALFNVMRIEDLMADKLPAIVGRSKARFSSLLFVWNGFEQQRSLCASHSRLHYIDFVGIFRSSMEFSSCVHVFGLRVQLRPARESKYSAKNCSV